MWSPTHTQVTVQRARNLLTKGKNGTNNCFVTIALGKEKYQTSVKEKSEPNVNWNEECELKIPDQGNRAELVLTCLHRNNLGIDEFLGQVTLPLNEMDVYDRPRSKWYKLESKPGKEKKNKERGELEVRITFIVKSGSLTDLSKKDKHKSSIGQLASSVGGSLLSIGTIEKRKGIKKFAKSLGSKMHLSSKKKNKDGDDNSSFSGSFASIGTPNSSIGVGGGGGGSRRFGQRAGDADPGVISEDEDEFVFENLSHKSSGSSLNIQRTGLQPPKTNFEPRNPSPLLSNGTAKTAISSKLNGGKTKIIDEDPIDPEMEQLELDFSVRARTLPPPSKPPRTATQSTSSGADSLTKDTEGTDTLNDDANDKKEMDEWATKLYGSSTGTGKYLDIGSSDSLKRRSWELARVPLPSASEAEQNLNESAKEKEKQEQAEKEKKEKPMPIPIPVAQFSVPPPIPTSSSSSSSSDTESELEEEVPPPTTAPPPPPVQQPKAPPKTLNLAGAGKPQTTSLLSPDGDKRKFDEFNATFAKFEQRHNFAKIFDSDLEHDYDSETEQKPFATAEKLEQQSQSPPQPKPRVTPNITKMSKTNELEAERAAAAAEAEAEAAAALRRAEEDARLEAELRLNEQRLREEEAALQLELAAEEQRRREAKRREEDQKLLDFGKRSASIKTAGDMATQSANGKPEPQLQPGAELELEPEPEPEAERVPEIQPTYEHNFLTPEQSPKEFSMHNGVGNGGGGGGDGGGSGSLIIGSGSIERREKQRLGKFKYANKRDKFGVENGNDSNSPSPKSTERIIIGHEKSATHAERRSEISAALAKKYEGKSREELMLIANGMENEALLQRQRVKELEDYLDNLLLRVMETHPKILQNPYSRTTSAKSG